MSIAWRPHTWSDGVLMNDRLCGVRLVWTRTREAKQVALAEVQAQDRVGLPWVAPGLGAAVSPLSLLFSLPTTFLRYTRRYWKADCHFDASRSICRCHIGDYQNLFASNETTLSIRGVASRACPSQQIFTRSMPKRRCA